MKKIHFYAISAAVVLLGGLALVLSGDPEPKTELQVLQSAVALPETTSTTELDLEISPGEGRELVLSSDELELTEEAARRSTTTTVSTTTTTTTPTTTVATTAPPKKPPATTTPTTAPTTTSPPTTSAGGYNSTYESEFRGLINSYRSSNGLARLSSHGDLNSRARWWAKEMATKYGLGHSDLSSLLPPWSAAAENVGMGGSVTGVFDLLVSSSGHRANMVGDYTHMGVGVWVDSSGTLWTAHVFTR